VLLKEPACVYADKFYSKEKCIIHIILLENNSNIITQSELQSQFGRTFQASGELRGRRDHMCEEKRIENISQNNQVRQYQTRLSVNVWLKEGVWSATVEAPVPTCKQDNPCCC